MEHLTELIFGTATGIFGIATWVIIHEAKKYLIAKGGKRAVEITEILARNAVNAVEQITKLDAERLIRKDIEEEVAARGNAKRKILDDELL